MRLFSSYGAIPHARLFLHGLSALHYPSIHLAPCSPGAVLAHALHFLSQRTRTALSVRFLPMAQGLRQCVFPYGEAPHRTRPSLQHGFSALQHSASALLSGRCAHTHALHFQCVLSLRRSALLDAHIFTCTRSSPQSTKPAPCSRGAVYAHALHSQGVHPTAPYLNRTRPTSPARFSALQHLTSALFFRRCGYASTALSVRLPLWHSASLIAPIFFCTGSAPRSNQQALCSLCTLNAITPHFQCVYPPWRRASSRRAHLFWQGPAPLQLSASALLTGRGAPTRTALAARLFSHSTVPHRARPSEIPGAQSRRRSQRPPRSAARDASVCCTWGRPRHHPRPFSSSSGSTWERERP